MKSAEEWRKEFKVWAEEWASDREVKQIQLDALKEGMRRAAKVTADYMHNAIHESRSAQAILTAAEKLTEKDL